MYHYVWDMPNAIHPDIKSLPLESFVGQLDYLQSHYTIISAEMLIAAIREGGALPPRSCLLSFDDAFIDHYTNVFPNLLKRNLSGAFFPPARVVLEHKVLDVTKIHFILASAHDVASLLQTLFQEVAALQNEYGLGSEEYYRAHADTSHNRWDDKDTALFKVMLQRELPERVRNVIADHLFRQYVTDDETAFAKLVYMSIDQMKEMRKHGMYFGNHGYTHNWLNQLPPEEQEDEIDRGLALLNDLGCNTEHWMMNYPYGGWNDSLLHILRRKGCSAGLSTRVGIADLDKDNPLLLPRLNTNDFPFSGAAATNEWFEKASS